MTMNRNGGLTKIVLVGAMLVTLIMLASPASVRAQRIAPVGFTSAHVSAPRSVPATIDIRASRVLAHATADSAANGGRSQAVGLGALAGAILGASYGYALGAADCDGESQAGCRRTALVSVAAVGSVLGALVGRVIQIGEEHDARRASARAVADSAASTPRPSHP